MEGGAYAGPKAGSEARSNGSLTTQVGDIEAAKAQFAREHAPSWRTRTWEHLKADVDADKVRSRHFSSLRKGTLLLLSPEHAFLTRRSRI
jgi:hypothetical protein